MTRFSAQNQSAATLKSPRKEIWDVLTDPQLLPELTPYLHNIEVEGDRWTWNVAKVPLLGKSIGTCFTEVMSFDEPRRIGFKHDPDQTGERSAVEGEYILEEVAGGTRVSIDLHVTVDLPFSRFMRPDVETGMSAVMALMGRRFAHNLLRHLGE